MSEGLYIDEVPMLDSAFPDWVRKALPDSPKIHLDFNPDPSPWVAKFIEQTQSNRTELVQRVGHILDRIEAAGYQRRRLYREPDMRAFYRHGVYEYFKNVGRKPYEWYVRHGELRGAYNERAGIWATH